KAYQEFRDKFGEDGNLLVIGVRTDSLFTEKMFNDYAELARSLKKQTGVEDVISIPSAINLVKDSATEKLNTRSIFPDRILTQSEVDSSRQFFLNLPFYQNLLYNPGTNAYLMGVRINKQVINSKKRNKGVGEIERLAQNFESANQTAVYL